MAGAIAGTALLDLKINKEIKEHEINLVTLTVNNSCNLDCPHCYLQYFGKEGYIEDKLVDVLVKDDFEHLAIVGKEPLYNKEHAKKTSELIKKINLSGKTVSIISNGLNLPLLENSNYLKFIDISFDGGPTTYKTFRNNNYSSLIQKIRNIKTKNSDININALHTLYEENISNIDDMVEINNDYAFGTILFSPYLETKNLGTNYVHKTSIDSLFEKLNSSKKFMDSRNTLLNIDIFHAKQYGLSMNEIKEKLSDYNLTSKVQLFETDLLNEGVVRITYDGLILSPEQSLHPAKYSNTLDLNSSLKNSFYKIFD